MPLLIWTGTTGLRSAPLVSAEIHGGESVLVVSWEATVGGCREGQSFTLQVAEVGSPTADGLWSGSWQTVNGDANEGRVVLNVAADLQGGCHTWCTFRLLPNDVKGWNEPTAHSEPVQPLRQGSTLLALLLTMASFGLLVLVGAAAFAIHTDPTLVETLADLRDANTRLRLWEAVREVLHTAATGGATASPRKPHLSPARLV